jgi:hypothetical protein
MHKRKLIVLLFLACFTQIVVLNAQTKEFHFMIKGEPLYLINNGLCIDIEKRLGNSTKWLMVSPQFYVNYDNKDNDGFGRDNYRSLIGAGLDLTFKNFAAPRGFLSTIYFGYGATWKYYDVKLSRETWIMTEEEGLNIYMPGTKVFNEKINKFGINAIVGMQNRMLKGVFFDIYTGLGIRYSTYESPGEADVKFTRGVWDLGYTGISLIGGVKIGVGF